MSEKEELYAKIHDFVWQEFLPDEAPDDVTPDLNLFESGVLDSLAVVHLTDFLEELCGTTLPTRDINPKTVGTISLMVAFVSSRREAAAAAASS